MFICYLVCMLKYYKYDIYIYLLFLLFISRSIFWSTCYEDKNEVKLKANLEVKMKIRKNNLQITWIRKTIKSYFIKKKIWK